MTSEAMIVCPRRRTLSAEILSRLLPPELCEIVLEYVASKYRIGLDRLLGVGDVGTEDKHEMTPFGLATWDPWMNIITLYRSRGDEQWIANVSRFYSEPCTCEYAGTLGRSLVFTTACDHCYSGEDEERHILFLDAATGAVAKRAIDPRPFELSTRLHVAGDKWLAGYSYVAGAAVYDSDAKLVRELNDTEGLGHYLTLTSDGRIVTPHVEKGARISVVAWEASTGITTEIVSCDPLPRASDVSILEKSVQLVDTILYVPADVDGLFLTLVFDVSCDNPRYVCSLHDCGDNQEPLFRGSPLHLLSPDRGERWLKVFDTDSGEIVATLIDSPAAQYRSFDGVYCYKERVSVYVRQFAERVEYKGS